MANDIRINHLEDRMGKVETDVREHRAIIHKALGAMFLAAFLIPIFTATLTAWVVKFWVTKP